MRALALYATKNEGGKSDATGAFIPEAKAFAAYHECPRAGFNNKLPATERMREVEAILDAHSGLDLIAFFCHGHRRRLQTEHHLHNVDALADAIARASAPRVVVALYACSTAGILSLKRGGFADALRDALTARGKSGHVDGHTVAGHCVWLPYVQRFDLGDPASEIVGDWIVEPRSQLWKRWRAKLRADGDDFCYRFPTQTIEQVRAELG